MNSFLKTSALVCLILFSVVLVALAVHGINGDSVAENDSSQTTDSPGRGVASEH